MIFKVNPRRSDIVFIGILERENRDYQKQNTKEEEFPRSNGKHL